MIPPNQCSHVSGSENRMSDRSHRVSKRGRSRRARRRSGAAAFDLALVFGVILPIVAVLLWIGPRIMMLVYEMIAVMVASPFM